MKMAKISLKFNMLKLSIFSIILLNFLSCSDPEIEEGILDSIEILDQSLLNPGNYLLSSKIISPTEEDLNTPVIIAVHGFSASTFEWDELKKYINENNLSNEVYISQVLLGGHGRSFKDFKASSYHGWQQSIEDEYIKLTQLGYKNISIIGSSTGCPLITDLLKRNFFQVNLKNIFFIDPIVIPSDKMLGLVGVLGPILGYIESDLDDGEEKYWYKYRPHETLNELNTLIIKVRKQLEDGININEKNLKVYKSIKDDAADPVSAVLFYKGINTNTGKIDVEMIDSDIHVYTRLDLRPNVSQKDIQNQQNTFNEIIQKVINE